MILHKYSRQSEGQQWWKYTSTAGLWKYGSMASHKSDNIFYMMHSCTLSITPSSVNLPNSLRAELETSAPCQWPSDSSNGFHMFIVPLHFTTNIIWQANLACLHTHKTTNIRHGDQIQLLSMVITKKLQPTNTSRVPSSGETAPWRPSSHHGQARDQPIRT